MAETFSLQDMYGAPVSSLSMNYEFDFLGENTRLIGANTVSYPPIDDGLVEREVEKFDEGTWWSNLGKGILATVGLAVLGAAIILTAPASVPAIITGCAAGCAIGGAVAAGVTTASVAYNDRKSGEVTSSEDFNQLLKTEIRRGMRVGAEIGLMIGGCIDTVNGLKAMIDMLSQLSAGGFGMSLATDIGMSISIGGASLEGVITLEQLAQLGMGLAGAGIASIAASDFKGMLDDIKFAKTTNGGSNDSSGYYQKGKKNVPNGSKRLRRDVRNVNSSEFKDFIRNQGKSFKSSEWKKVMETWETPSGKKIEVHYWRNSKTGEIWSHK